MSSDDAQYIPSAKLAITSSPDSGTFYNPNTDRREPVRPYDKIDEGGHPVYDDKPKYVWDENGRREARRSTARARGNRPPAQIKNPQDVLVVLPDDPKARKRIPIFTGLLDYFPAALAEIAQLSVGGNDQHNPGQELHWARGKSSDHADTIGRHMMQRGTRDTDGVRHMAKAAWRALALLQEEIEWEQGFVPAAERSEP